MDWLCSLPILHKDNVEHCLGASPLYVGMGAVLLFMLFLQMYRHRDCTIDMGQIQGALRGAEADCFAEKIEGALAANNVRIYYAIIDDIHNSGVNPVNLVACVIVDEPEDYSRYDIKQCVIHVGRRSISPMYFETYQPTEEAFARIENSSSEVYRRVRFYSKEHAVEILGILKDVSAANKKWRPYFDQADRKLCAVFEIVKNMQ